MSRQSRLRPPCGVNARRRTGGTDSARPMAGSRGNFNPFETLEGRRLLSGTYQFSGRTDVIEGDYQLTLSVSGAGAMPVQMWNVDWGDGSDLQPVLANGAASVTVTHNFDGDDTFRIRATATLTNSTVVVAESANHNGSLDTTFNSGNPKVDLAGLPKAVVVDSEGRTIAAFQQHGAQDNVVKLRRYTATGNVDTSFGNNALDSTTIVGFEGNADDHELALLLHGGFIYVGGTSTDDFGDEDFAVARFFVSSGAPDTGYGVRLTEGGGADSINALAAQGSNIIAVGHSSGQARILRVLGTNGALDTVFGTGGIVSSGTWAPSDVVVLGDLSIVAAGQSAGGGLRVEKFGSSGAFSWQSNAFAGSFGIHASIAVQTDARIVVGGESGIDVALARFNPADGALDETFAPGGTYVFDSGDYDAVYDVVVQPNGRIVTLGGAVVGGKISFAVTGFRSMWGQVSPDTGFGADAGGGHTYTTIGTEIAEIRAATLTPGGSIVAAGVTDFGPNHKVVVARYGREMALTAGDVPPELVIEDHVFIGIDQPVLLEVREPARADREALYSGYIDFDFHGVGDEDGIVFGVDPNTNEFYGDTVPPPMYAAAGSYRVSVSIFDKDGFGTFREFDVHVGIGNFGAVVVDPTRPGDMMLLIGAADAPSGAGVANKVTVGPAAHGTQVTVDGATTVYPGVIDRVVVYGQGGDDTLQVKGDLTLPVELFGGAGNDKLKGGGLDDVLAGGDGNDLVVAGGGRDLLIGGSGQDKLVGDSDDDILIGAMYSGSGDRNAIAAVMAEWGRLDQTYAQRVDHLRYGTGLNGGHALVVGVTVLDDGVEDKLTGDSGLDWFFANADGEVNDKVTDLSSSEFSEEEISFINEA